MIATDTILINILFLCIDIKFPSFTRNISKVLFSLFPRLDDWIQTHKYEFGKGSFLCDCLLTITAYNHIIGVFFHYQCPLNYIVIEVPYSKKES